MTERDLPVSFVELIRAVFTWVRESLLEWGSEYVSVPRALVEPYTRTSLYLSVYDCERSLRKITLSAYAMTTEEVWECMTTDGALLGKGRKKEK